MFHLVSEFRVKMVEVIFFFFSFKVTVKKRLNPGTGN